MNHVNAGREKASIQVKRRLPGRSAIGLGATVLAASMVVAGCGSGSPSSGAGGQAASTIPSPNGQSSASRADGRGGTRPGASGKISQVNATSLYVIQSAVPGGGAGGDSGGGQVTVNFTASTTFTQTSPVNAAALKVGDCVSAVARPAMTSATPSARPTANRSALTKLTATTVTITGTAGSCSRGSAPSARPTNRPRPTASPGTRGRFGGGGFGAAFGVVASLHGNGFVVAQTRTTNTSTATPSMVTVTTTGATSYQQTGAATKAALKVGQCATAIGSTDDTGAVTARSIAVSPPTNGTCGFGGFGGFRGRGGAGTQAGPGSAGAS
jgi:hypothetical protein